MQKLLVLVCVLKRIFIDFFYYYYYLLIFLNPECICLNLLSLINKHNIIKENHMHCLYLINTKLLY